jgi:heme-degrading monooxygenase HmoA
VNNYREEAMPVVQVSQAGSRGEYESVSSQLDLQGDRPPGLILHSASETASGEVEIVDVWESAEAARAFEQERLLPIFEAAGLMDAIGSRPQPVAYEPFDYLALESVR